MAISSVLLVWLFRGLLAEISMIHVVFAYSSGRKITGRILSPPTDRRRCRSHSKVTRPAEASFDSVAAQASRTEYVSNIIQRQTAVIDGAEWRSYKRLGLFPSQGDGDTGRFSVVVWEDSKGQRWVAWAATLSKNDVYQESISLVPSSTSTLDAMNTMMLALPVHVVRSRLEVKTSSFSSSHVVVWGSTVRAQQAATTLKELGAKKVTIVTTNNIQLPGIDVLPPAVTGVDDSDDEEDENTNMLPVCSALQSFDALIDTLGVESELGVLSLLKARHGCHTYLSTLSHSQELIERKGLLFGPGAAKSYQERVARSASPYLLVPPIGLGGTVSSILNAGCVLKAEGGKVGDVYTSGWSLPAFWESTTWPRDTDGGGGRFGMPVVRDLLDFDQDDEDDDVHYVSTTTLSLLPDSVVVASDENPFVRTVLGVTGLQQRIIQPQEDCLLFLSAPFCRTCRYLGPSYTRMARLNKGKIVFAKADTSGLLGKELGRYLRVESVPSFVFFSKGRRVGKPLGITKIPSPKLQAKVDKLAMNGDLDEDDDEEDADDT